MQALRQDKVSHALPRLIWIKAAGKPAP